MPAPTKSPVMGHIGLHQLQATNTHTEAKKTTFSDMATRRVALRTKKIHGEPSLASEPLGGASWGPGIGSESMRPTQLLLWDPGRNGDHQIFGTSTKKGNPKFWHL